MDWREIIDERERYAAYLCSREWGVLREAVRQRAFGRCERCFLNKMDAVHHLSYERKYCENLSDLQAICTPCHEFTHGKSFVDPRDAAAAHPSFIGESCGSILQCPVCMATKVIMGHPSSVHLAARYSATCTAFFGTHCVCHKGHSWWLNFIQSARGFAVLWIDDVNFAAEDAWETADDAGMSA